MEDFKIKKTYSYEIETYAFLKHLDKSVLAINPVLKKFGYKLICHPNQRLTRGPLTAMLKDLVSGISMHLKKLQ